MGAALWVYMNTQLSHKALHACFAKALAVSLWHRWVRTYDFAAAANQQPPCCL